jgi:hypothetical protein
MSDVLWSDPQPFPGRGPSKRGVGQSFGPDVTERFLSNNGLQLVVRSHEVMDNGYQMFHAGKLITVFRYAIYAAFDRQEDTKGICDVCAHAVLRTIATKWEIKVRLCI